MLISFGERLTSLSKPSIEMRTLSDNEPILDQPRVPFPHKNVLPATPVIQDAKRGLISYGEKLRFNLRLVVANECGAPRRQVVADLGCLALTCHGRYLRGVNTDGSTRAKAKLGVGREEFCYLIPI